MSVLSQIFNATQNVWILLGFVKNLFFEPNFQYCQSTTQNFWILPNFIVGMSRVVKTLNFGLNFYCDWKFLNFTNFHLSHVLNGQKCQFWAKFLTRIKISSLAGQGWSNSRFQVKLQRDWKYLKNIKISLFHQILSFLGPEWSKFSILSQIFNATQNFWILPNFIVRASRVVKNVNFEPNSQPDLKCLHFANFQPSQVGPEWSKMSILIQILTGTKNFRILPNFIIGRSGVIKNLIFEPYFRDKSKFFWIMSNFILVSEWTKLSFLSQIFNATENFLIWPNFLLCMSLVFKTLKFCGQKIFILS